MKKSSTFDMTEIMKLPFVQYDATGNTFALMDNRSHALHGLSHLAVQICESRKVDGLLVMESSKKADLKMRIVNPDGSEVSMCGNGSRAAIYWAHHRQGFPESFKMETGAGLLEAHIKGSRVKVRLTNPRHYPKKSEVEAAGQTWNISSINTGVPHAVIQTSNVEAIDVESVGRAIRQAKEFSPEGTNVTFYEIQGPGHIRIRTYERGVEHETLSCGTGATAAALVAQLDYRHTSPVNVLTRSGKELLIHFVNDSDVLKDVYLEGDVEEVGEGVYVEGEEK